ncbi:MAG: type II toxin-antitoxin system PemK/MazF family toxin [Austwickia sp.]|jgi:hypothetical protein|nr:type II toxin-antitoxin system PemK/MazF family toxin [Austwickia sp.]MBK8435109.1 type II toxin-antitoxin system PemK/MazF family toxin [Austwickia sp.]MBK9101338.1 type II toxin-antitoxin system PemK/MazF family toxin [Austwickia sp.]
MSALTPRTGPWSRLRGTAVRVLNTARRRTGSAARGDTSPTPGGGLAPSYAPRADDRADPGEIVWAWVPFEDDPTRGKDRPVLVIARSGPVLQGLYLSSQDHDRDAADEARHGRYWMDIGSGPWDSRGRPSQVRLDRVVALNDSAVRRVGATIDRGTFDRVTGASARHRQ